MGNCIADDDTLYSFQFTVFYSTFLNYLCDVDLQDRSL